MASRHGRQSEGAAGLERQARHGRKRGLGGPGQLVAQYLQTLKARGISVLLVEQKLAIALDISQRVLVMGRGSIVFEGTPAELRDNAAIRKEWLEV